MKILVTGSAGFIGYHLVKSLLKRGDEVVGLDNINDYYEVRLKYGRLWETGISEDDIQYGKEQASHRFPAYRFIKLDLIDKAGLKDLFERHKFDVVCNLAAQAGVRYSLENPDAYIESNICGFGNILECCRHNRVKHLVYASSSSVYGLNSHMPFSTHDNVDHPVSLYAASKKSNELMAHCYSHLFGLPTTGLRFFTVYGPWGRPDMALFIFTKALMEGRPIEVFNNGEMMRDFTYIDDIVGGVVRVFDNVAEANPLWNSNYPDPGTSTAPYRIFNIGRGESVGLMEFVSEIESNLGITGVKHFKPMQDGDVPKTWSDVSDLEKILNYKPGTSVKQGIKNFISWYKQFYKPVESLAPQVA